MHLNMLPLQYRRRQIVVRRVCQWSVGWALAFGVVLMLGWFQATDCRRLTAELEVLEGKYNRLQRMEATLRTAQNELHDLEQRESLVLELSQRRPMLSLLSSLSLAAQRCDGNVSVRQLQWQVGDGNERAGAQQSLRPLLTLEGVGVDNYWVAQFAAALREDAILSEVQLKSTEQQIVNGRAAHGYELECSVH